MSLQQNYQDVLTLAEQLGLEGREVEEKEGKLRVKAEAPYQYEKDLLWDKIKTHASWESELSADIRVQNTDVYGYHTVQSGDTLSKIAKSAYDDPSQYKRIFEANRDILKDPDQIRPGQRLKLPLKS